MIPIRCKAVSGVALTTVDGETKLLMMKRVKGGLLVSCGRHSGGG